MTKGQTEKLRRMKYKMRACLKRHGQNVEEGEAYLLKWCLGECLRSLDRVRPLRNIRKCTDDEREQIARRVMHGAKLKMERNLTEQREFIAAIKESISI